MSNFVFEWPMRWAFRRPIGDPRVYRLVSSGVDGFSMQAVIDDEREWGGEARAVRAYWWPWSEAW